MPRLPRVMASTGIYHIMLRGVNRVNIFINHDDKAKFMEILRNMNSKGEYTLYGYCIMDNHVHLLMKEESDSISRTMKRICISYSHYFNKKYERVGHLFQDRFRSERIESEDYLLACIRYIHNNPVKAFIVREPSDYEWSSYNAYMDKYDNEDEIVSTEFILNIFSENKSMAIKEFQTFSALNCENVFMDLEETEDVVEKTRLEKIEQILKRYKLTLEDLPELKDKKIRTKVIREINDNVNLSTRQMSNIIGIGKDTIARALKDS